jgi:hypothetical protein
VGRLRPRPPLWTPADLGADLLGWWDASRLDGLHAEGAAVASVPDLSGNGRHLLPAGGSVNFTYGLRGLPGVKSNVPGYLRWTGSAGQEILASRDRFYVGLVFHSVVSDPGYFFSIPRGSGSNGFDMSLSGGGIDAYLNSGGGLEGMSATLSWGDSEVYLIEQSIDYTLGTTLERTLSAGDEGVSTGALANANIGVQNAELNVFDFGTGFSSPAAGIALHELIIAATPLRDRAGILWRRYCRAKWGANVATLGAG